MHSIRPYARHSKNTTGFTLIEVMVVMVLITIILAVAIPRFDGGVLQDPTKQLTRRLINTARSLRSQAVQKQQPQTLFIDLDNQRLWIAGAAQDEQTEATTQEKAFDLPSSLRFVEVQFPKREPVNSGTVEVNFYPAGYSDHVILHVQKDHQDRFSYLVEPLLPKIKLLDRWIDF